MLLMAKKRKGSRHAPRSMISLPRDLYDQLKKLAGKNGRPINWEARMVIQKALEESSLWPPSRPDPT